MMLVQKPPVFNLSQPAAYSHRRHPSAPPAVVVQPTRTPGLLFIAKPQKTSPQRQLPSAQRRNGPKPRPLPLVARPPNLLNPAEIAEKRTVLQPPASPSPVRGRLVPKERASRSTSSKHGRQPSPPVDLQMHHSSPAEAPSTNHFDPFLEPTKPQPPASIPIPSQPRQQHHQLARSAPTASSMHKNLKPPRFPVRDDMTDAGDVSESESTPPQTPPATPLRTAPLFKPSYPSLSSTQKKSRKHRRSPSEGVFAMSSDEEVSVSEQDLLSFARNRAQNPKPPTTPTPSLSRATAAGALKDSNQTAGYFASSLFQNSPSPDELPDPILF